MKSTFFENQPTGYCKKSNQSNEIHRPYKPPGWKNDRARSHGKRQVGWKADSIHVSQDFVNNTASSKRNDVIENRFWLKGKCQKTIIVNEPKEAWFGSGYSGNVYEQKTKQ